MIIESLGVYLPERLVATAELLKACRRVPVLPFERLTGIERRPVAGPMEYSIDLARQAVRRCLALSRRPSEPIDLVLCCNISRCDGPDQRMSIEPTTASRLCAEFGLSTADAFDVSNACGGVFTGLLLAQVAFATGAARRALIVSGEHITHLATTAQREIESLSDPRIACLTLGDSGVAILVEGDGPRDVGFQALDLFTLGQYSGLCTGTLTDRPHGGAIMLTDSRQLTEAALEHCVPHNPATMKKHDWHPDDVDVFITHQTAKRALDKARAELNRHMGRTWLEDRNFVCNVRDRGNLATNSHFVALYDRARQGPLRNGQRVVFSISASGLTGGTALYRLDDLPDRLRQHRNGYHRPPPRANDPAPSVWRPGSNICLESIGATDCMLQPSPGVVELATAAARDCLSRSRYNFREVEVVIYCGVYRERLLSEPAVASMVAGQLGIDQTDSPGRYSKLAFDVSDGALGFLKACHCAAQVIESGRARRVLVIAAETQGNPAVVLRGAAPVAAAASAAMVAQVEEGQAGFRWFAFQSFVAHHKLRTSYCRRTNGSTHLHVDEDRSFLDAADESIADSLGLLQDVGALAEGGLHWLLRLGHTGPKTAAVMESLGLPPDRVISLISALADPYTSSLTRAWQTIERSPHLRPGQRMLIVQASAGMRVGCSLYTMPAL